MHISSMENPWGKTFTDKRYLHPPFSECIVTSWGSSMVLYGEFDGKGFSQHPRGDIDWESTLPSAGVIFTVKRGTPASAMDYINHPLSGEFMPATVVKYNVREDGAPIHSMIKDFIDFKFSQEVFCDNQRVPITYIKVTIENGFEHSQKFSLCALLRSGYELELIGGGDCSGYCRVKQDENRWRKLKSFHEENGYYTDGVYKLYFSKEYGLKPSTTHDLKTEIELSANEKKTFYFAFTRNTNKPKKYGTARKIAVDFWREQISKAINTPKDKKMKKVFNNLLAQCLQMFCHRQGHNNVLIRQGGVIRFVWPTEARSVIEAMSQIGGYEDYLAPAVATYFDLMQTKTGEDAGKITTLCNYQWATNPASVLESFAYASLNDDKLFNKYIEDAMLSYRWIEKQRAKTYNMEGVVNGLFPPALSSDFGGTGQQIWGHTDCWMLQGIKEFVKILKEKNSPYYDEVKKGYDDYYKILESVLDGITTPQRDNDKIYLPHDAKNDPELEKELNKVYISISLKIANYLYQGFGGYGSEVQKKVFEAHFPSKTNKNGFYSSVYTSTSGVGQTWYITFTEYTLYRYFGIIGDKKAQKRIFDSLMKYALTNEYYLSERYDPYKGTIASWLPNASANARVLMMILDQDKFK